MKQSVLYKSCDKKHMNTLKKEVVELKKIERFREIATCDNLLRQKSFKQILDMTPIFTYMQR